MRCCWVPQPPDFLSPGYFPRCYDATNFNEPLASSPLMDAKNLKAGDFCMFFFSVKMYKARECVAMIAAAAR